MSTATPREQVLKPFGRRRRLIDFIREFALIAALLGVYKLGRTLAVDEVRQAIGNAWHVWSFERTLRLPSELTFQQEAMRWRSLVTVANVYYAVVHFPATFGFLAWLWWRDRHSYRWYRTVLGVMTAIALAIHITYPLAPPRMMPSLGFVDTGKLFGPSVYANSDTDAVTNQFAAMPSLHVGWAVVVAIGVIMVLRTRWRWLVLIHPAATLAVVVATANHYWLDGIVGIMLIIPGVLAARWHPIARMRARRFRFPARAARDDQVAGDDLVLGALLEEPDDPAQGDNREAAPGGVPSPRSPLSGEEQAQRRLVTTEHLQSGAPEAFGANRTVRRPGGSLGGRPRMLCDISARLSESAQRPSRAPDRRSRASHREPILSRSRPLR
jgi:PAP2 superfamily protein